MTTDPWLCDVYEFRPAKHVLASPYGAVSFAYCEFCAKLGLEPTGFVELVAIELCGGWEHTADHLRGYPALALGHGLRSLHS